MYEKDLVIVILSLCNIFFFAFGQIWYHNYAQMTETAQTKICFSLHPLRDIIRVPGASFHPSLAVSHHPLSPPARHLHPRPRAQLRCILHIVGWQWYCRQNSPLLLSQIFNNRFTLNWRLRIQKNTIVNFYLSKKKTRKICFNKHILLINTICYFFK